MSLIARLHPLLSLFAIRQVVASSGDDGAHTFFDQSCSSDSLLNSDSYPASSPYVLAVGATQIKPGSAKRYHQTPICRTVLNSPIPCAYPGTGTEIAASTKTQSFITSGGGFATFESVGVHACFLVAIIVVYIWCDSFARDPRTKTAL